MSITKVYRIGTLAQQEHTDSAIKQWSPFDAVKPVGRTGRLDSLYASPDLAGLVRWVRAMHSVNAQGEDLTSREIAVTDKSEIYVYSVKAYDKARVSKNYAHYWESGIRLSDWHETAKACNLDSSDWEVLLPFDHVSKATNVSDARILKATSENWIQSELKSAFKKRKLVF